MRTPAAEESDACAFPQYVCSWTFATHILTIVQIKLIFWSKNLLVACAWTNSESSDDICICGLTITSSITSFGDRPNEYVTVLEYFKGHFQHMHRKHNSGNRWLYTHYTRVVVCALITFLAVISRIYLGFTGYSENNERW
jgi:hypothetical protein